MHLISYISALVATLSLVSAVPAAGKEKFTVVTKGVNGKGKYDSLSLTGYHTGAGENAPGFSKAGFQFYLNDTRLSTNIGGYPYSLAIGDVEDLYAEWGALTLNAGLGDTGFSINKKGYIIFNPKRYGWTGWRVCNWVHGVPQLYFDIYPQKGIAVPSNCELVYLQALPVP